MSRVIILHTNDIHGRVEGLARVATLVARIRAEHPDTPVLYLDAGDVEETTSRLSNLTKGVAMHRLLNLAGCAIAAGFVDFGTDLKNPDFAKLAEAAGVLGLTAETPQDVRPMITQALKHDGPALVEVFVHRQELSMPPTISLAQMKGFTLFTLRAVLSGRGDEVVDLAKINLFR